MLLDDNYFDIPDLYYSDYHSEMKSKDQKEIINNFEKAKFGIITCVYCLGEGWDFPLLDGVVFSENMTSNIRIVQSALRASRKNKNDINKKTKIILPILNRDDWLENTENPDLKKVREVIYQMGLEDETITQKIKVFRIEIEKQKPKPKEKEEREIVDEFGEYDDELTQKLRLKTIKRTALATTYEKARKIIADKNIKSKESYYELCERDNRLSKEPEIVFKGQFTNWIEYLSIERVYYDLETCKNKVGEYLLLYPEIKKHYLDLSIVSNELCKIDSSFPPNRLWVEYYNVKDVLAAGLAPEQVFRDFIDDSGFLILEQNEKLVQVVNRLRAEGFWIHLLTARPSDNLKCFHDSYMWLSQSDLSFDALDFSGEKFRWLADQEFYKEGKVVCAVDDSPKHATEYAKHGVRVFSPVLSYNTELKNIDLVTLFSPEEDLYDLIKNSQK